MLTSNKLYLWEVRFKNSPAFTSYVIRLTVMTNVHNTASMSTCLTADSCLPCDEIYLYEENLSKALRQRHNCVYMYACTAQCTVACGNEHLD